MDAEHVGSPVTDPLREEQHHLSNVLHAMDTMLAKLRGMSHNPDPEAVDRTEAETAEEVAESVVERIRGEQIFHLNAAKSEPYFGRLDFQEYEHPLMPLYIGKRGIEHHESGDRLVVDWRAPVASLFYSFSGQDSASYETRDGTIEGQVHLKRNIQIRNQELQRVVDSYVRGQDNLNVTDEFLLYRLEENKDNRLRDIVSTIQAEQDRIIRADRNKAIVIQGVAGSGKTTVALHRLAFLLYQHAEHLNPERMVIFAPNAMFVDYISEVLPELGVGGIQQTTFTSWALRLLDHQVQVRSAEDRMIAWFDTKTDPTLERQFRVSRHKGSTSFQEQVDTHLQRLETDVFPEGDFEAWDGKVLRESVIRDWYQKDYSHYALSERIERVLARVKRWYEIQYKDIKAADKTGVIKKTAAQRFRTYKAKWPVLTPTTIYQEILADTLPEAESFTGPIITMKSGRKRRLEVNVEDLAPLVYIHLKLHGVTGRDHFQHVVIDEAQDFSPFQMNVLRAYCPSDSFTILGDLSQSIHTYQGVTTWDDFLSLFGEDKRMYFQLDVSYRSTMEIIDFANDIIRPFKEFSLAKPVFRSGEPVTVTKVPPSMRNEHLVRAVQSLQEDANTVAVVGRTERDCQTMHEVLRQAGVDSTLISAKNQEYKGGISVLPVYLTKGLEFDAVLLVDVNEGYYDMSPLSAKLLYVGCTRALHKLWVMCSNQPSPLLPNTKPSTV